MRICTRIVSSCRGPVIIPAQQMASLEVNFGEEDCERIVVDGEHIGMGKASSGAEMQ